MTEKNIKAPTQGERIVAIEVKLDTVVEQQQEMMKKIDALVSTREDMLKCQEGFDRRYVLFQNFELKVKEIIDNYTDKKVVQSIHKGQLWEIIIKIGQVLLPVILAGYILIQGTAHRVQGTGAEQMQKGSADSIQRTGQSGAGQTTP